MKKNNKIGRILDACYLKISDINWIKNKRIFKKYIKEYYKELSKNKVEDKKVNKKSSNNDDIEILDFTQKIDITDEEAIEILDFTKTIDVSMIVDINKAKEKAKRRVIIEQNVLISIITFCVIMGIILFISFIFSLGNDNKSRNITDDLNKMVRTKEIGIEDADSLNETKDDLYKKYGNLNMLEVDFDDLLNTNSDTKGWIKVSGTRVNYPFVQSDNNNYYLKHSYDKSYNKKGWVFLDFRNNIDNLDKNTILYAHGLVNNEMFGSLRKIIKESWYKNNDNHIISMSTPSYDYLWEVFSSYLIEPESYYITTNFNSRSEFLKFVSVIKKRSVYDYNVSVSEDDKILTLSSCYSDSKRMVLHAKLIVMKKR